MESWSASLRVRSSWLQFIGAELAFFFFFLVSALSLRLNIGPVWGDFYQNQPFYEVLNVVRMWKRIVIEGVTVYILFVCKDKEWVAVLVKTDHDGSSLKLSPLQH